MRVDEMIINLATAGENPAPLRQYKKERDDEKN